ncbi:MAG TPA: hypothetical protein PLP61_15950, partial [Nocardioides sp.]|uniref:hypothetical protein n=1 Tax=Nocardioides sp. TaxID=35761 RepID=UPI002BC6F8A3
MTDPAAFDAFYQDARQRLLHQTYALTGDLPAAYAAVRDAFVGAWHHWDRVSLLADPEPWVRPLAWSHAQRRHGARVWHRGRSDVPGVAETLDALGRLTTSQRKMLLLTHLTRGSMTDLAREAELPLATAERELQSATALFAAHRGIDSPTVRVVLDQLAEVTADHHWPRPTIIRRAGSARRRTHTLVGAAAVVGVLLASGAAVSHGGGVRPRLTEQTVVASASPVASTPAPAPVELTPDRLLTARQLGRVAPDRRWSVRTTSPTGPDSAPSLPCQDTALPGPATQGLVRTYLTSPGPRTPPAQRQESVAATQSSLLASTPRAARRTFTVAAESFAGCVQDRVQLLSTERLDGVGDEAVQLVLRSWAPPVTTMVVGVARTGRVTTTTMSSRTGSQAPDLASHAALLAAAVNTLCGAPGTGSCAAPPTRTRVAPLPTGAVPGMLSTIDLPPVTSVDDAWVGTDPRRATVNAAATQCDRAEFTERPITHALTRTFLFPRASLPATFGLTETVGTMPQPAAQAFVAGLRERLAGCEDKSPGTQVVRLADTRHGEEELTVWRVDVELSDTATATYLMGIARSGTAVAQVGFTPTGEVRMTPEAFVALVDRARERLPQLPAP